MNDIKLATSDELIAEFNKRFGLVVIVYGEANKLEGKTQYEIKISIKGEAFHCKNLLSCAFELIQKAEDDRQKGSE